VCDHNVVDSEVLASNGESAGMAWRTLSTGDGAADGMSLGESLGRSLGTSLGTSLAEPSPPVSTVGTSEAAVAKGVGAVVGLEIIPSMGVPKSLKLVGEILGSVKGGESSIGRLWPDMPSEPPTSSP